MKFLAGVGSTNVREESITDHVSSKYHDRAASRYKFIILIIIAVCERIFIFHAESSRSKLVGKLKFIFVLGTTPSQANSKQLRKCP